MESGFMMALDYMIQLAHKDQDNKRKSLLEVVKEIVLSHITEKCPPQVNFLTKLVAPKPGKTVQQMIQNVMQGKDEGANDRSNEEDSSAQGTRPSGLNGRGSVTGGKPLPLRP